MRYPCSRPWDPFRLPMCGIKLGYQLHPVFLERMLPRLQIVDNLTPVAAAYRGTSLIRKRDPLGLYRRPLPRDLGGSCGGVRFLMSDVPLHP